MQTTGLNRWRVFAVTLSLLACVPQPSEGSRVAKERSAAVGAPLISADFGLAARALLPNPEAPIASVTAGPGGYLVLADVLSDPSYHQLRATLVPSNGESTPTTGRVLAQVTVPESNPEPVRAVRAGDHWLVVYAGLAIPVDDTGAPGVTVDLPELGGSLAGMSFDGDRALVVSTAGQGIFLNPSGQPLGDPFALFPPDRWTYMPGWASVGEVAFDGTHHVVIGSTRQPAAVLVASIASTGPTGKVTTLFNSASPRVFVDVGGRMTGGASGALALYTGPPSSCEAGGRCLPPLLYYRTLASQADGTIVAGVEQQQAVDPSLKSVFVAGNYLLYSGSAGRWLDQNGMPTGTPAPSLLPALQVLQATSGVGPVLSLAPAEDGNAFLAFAGTAAARLAGNFGVLDDPALTPLVLPTPQRTPVVTFRGDHYLALWNDVGRGGIHATRVQPGATVVDSVPIPVAMGDATPFVASAGASSFVGWIGINTFGAATISSAGDVTPVDLPPLAPSFVGASSLATDGNGYLLTTSVHTSPAALRAQLFSAAGVLSSELDFDTIPARTVTTFDGEHYVVVSAFENGGTVELRAVRFTSSLDLVDAQPRVLLQYPGDVFDLHPSIASDGEGFVIAWTQGSSSTLRMARVSQELDVLDAGGVVVEENSELVCGPELAWDGSSYWLLWHGTQAPGESQVAVVGQRFDVNLAPVDSAPFEVTRDLVPSSVCPDGNMALSSDGNGEVLLTYAEADLVDHVPSARARWLRSEVDGGEGGEGGEGDEGGEGGEGCAGSSGGSPGTGGVGTGGTHPGGEGGTPPDGTGGSATGGRAGTSAMGGGGTRAGGAGGATASGGTFGTSGEGGALAGGVGGGSGAGGGKPPPEQPGSGCGCSVPGRAVPSGWATLIAASLLLTRRRRSAAHRFAGRARL
jgi:hypothetical protein